MKQGVILLLALSMSILSLTGCGKKEVKPDNPNNVSNNSGNKVEENLTKEQKVKRSVEKILKYSKENNIDELAKYIVYRGEDETRNWKDYANASDAFERTQVEDGASIIRAYLNNIDGYEFGSYTVENESEGEWNIVEVTFKRGTQQRKVKFAMLYVKDDYRLGDIERMD